MPCNRTLKSQSLSGVSECAVSTYLGSIYHKEIDIAAFQHSFRKKECGMAISRILGITALVVAIGIGFARYNISNIKRNHLQYDSAMYMDVTSAREPEGYTPP